MTAIQTDKQRALLDGALRVFARDGYSRASIQALAREAGVSTRTIYNQYGDKSGLFRAVILDSATRVAEFEIARAELLLGRIADLEADLVTFGIAWSTPDPQTATHFAMIRQVRADEAHIDRDILDAWRAAGPIRVQTAIATHLRRHADAGLLHIDNEQIAALHLVQLTAGSVSAAGAQGDPDTLVRAGVATFLAAYQHDASTATPRRSTTTTGRS